MNMHSEVLLESGVDGKDAGGAPGWSISGGLLQGSIESCRGPRSFQPVCVVWWCDRLGSYRLWTGECKMGVLPSIVACSGALPQAVHRRVSVGFFGERV
jgi:hypothetical protein